jgi:cyanate permease
MGQNRPRARKPKPEAREATSVTPAAELRAGRERGGSRAGGGRHITPILQVAGSLLLRVCVGSSRDARVKPAAAAACLAVGWHGFVLRIAVWR